MAERLPPVANFKAKEFSLTRSDITVELNPFALRFTPDPQEKETITAAIAAHCATFREEDHSDEPSQWCAVRRSSVLWSRAEVLACYEDQYGFASGAEVEYIDEGIREFVAITDIFPLDSRLLAHPPQSVRVMPDGVTVEDVAKASELFNEFPEIKVRVRINASKGRSGRPHAIALRGRIMIGHEAFIDFGELCERLKIGHRVTEGSAVTETIQNEDRNGSVQRPSENFATYERSNSNTAGEPGSAPSPDKSDRSTGLEDTERSRDSESATETSPEQFRTPESMSDCLAEPEQLFSTSEITNGQQIERASTPQSGDHPQDDADDDDDNFQSVRRRTDREIQRKIQHASIIKQRTERKTRACMTFLRMGSCDNGDNCPNAHDQAPRTLVVSQDSRVMRECPQIELDLRHTMFVMITYIDELFDLYVVPIYGTTSIWSALEYSKATDVCVPDIQRRLHEFYEPQREAMRPRAGLSNGQMVAVWLGENGDLSGWHRAKLVDKGGSSVGLRVFLVDHGCELEAPASNMFNLDSKFLEHPAQAIRCTLGDTKIKSGVSVDTITSRLLGHVYIMQVDDRSTETQRVVHLFSESAVESVAEVLESEGLIEFTNSLE